MGYRNASSLNLSESRIKSSEKRHVHKRIMHGIGSFIKADDNTTRKRGIQSQARKYTRLVPCWLLELEMCAVLVVRGLRYGDLAPEIGCKEGVCFCDLKDTSIKYVNMIIYQINGGGRTATKVAFKKLPMVAVLPLDCVYTSWIPASWSRRLDAGAATIPVPRGAGMSRHMTEPTFPLTFDGTVWGSWRAAPQ